MRSGQLPPPGPRILRRSAPTRTPMLAVPILVKPLTARVPAYSHPPRGTFRLPAHRPPLGPTAPAFLRPIPPVSISLSISGNCHKWKCADISSYLRHSKKPRATKAPCVLHIVEKKKFRPNHPHVDNTRHRTQHGDCGAKRPGLRGTARVRRLRPRTSTTRRRGPSRSRAASPPCGRSGPERSPGPSPIPAAPAAATAPNGHDG